MPERAPPMSLWLRDLGRNLWSGALLVFAQPVSKLRFRIGVPQLLVLFVVSAWLDLAVDTARREPGATFMLTGLVSEGFYGALLMLFAALLAMIFRQPSFALALPAKFAATIQEALGYEPKRPPAYEGLEALPQRFVSLPADSAAVKAFVAEHAHA